MLSYLVYQTLNILLGVVLKLTRSIYNYTKHDI